MPNVDFTLEDVRKLVHEETPVIVERALIKERSHTQELFAKERAHTQQLFVQEREYTRVMIQEGAEDVKQTIADEFLNFWEINLGPSLDELHDDVRDIKHNVAGIGRLVDRHSKDIMALRAREA